jgi:oxygen-independent coproporphyrinogen-3 oxidase
VAFGIYISIPFCRSKCSFCNFASGVVSRAVYTRYIDRVCADISRADSLAAEIGGRSQRHAASIYLGGGTPTVLEPAELERIFTVVRAQFEVDPAAEATIECAPGTLKPQMVETLLRCGVNRVSLGVQSFVDKEAASVGRLHTRAVVLDDLARLRAAGIENISLDLIAGLPHQTAATWRYSLNETIASAVPHVSVYMLEVDEDSRLGNELLAGGTRYHAHFVPNDDATAEFYLEACATLESAGIHQYEISNFARDGSKAPASDASAGAPHLPGFGRCGSFLNSSDGLPYQHSRHNLKYWTRQPYLGFGVDAHSMLPSATPKLDAVRFATPGALEQYLASSGPAITPVSPAQALEEACFLGLRLNRGIRLEDLREFREQIREQRGEEQNGGDPATTSAPFREALAELQQEGLLQIVDGWLRLTPRGRLLSNEVFERFLNTESNAAASL